jgi:hypothetical protein
MTEFWSTVTVLTIVVLAVGIVELWERLWSRRHIEDRNAFEAARQRDLDARVHAILYPPATGSKATKPFRLFYDAPKTKGYAVELARRFGIHPHSIHRIKAGAQRRQQPNWTSNSKHPATADFPRVRGEVSA